MTSPATVLDPPDAPALSARADVVLRALVGRDDAQLRPDQWAAIHALVVERRRALVVQRTGWGKSAVYFIATALLREQGAGPTVIVSPLLSLMRNQVDAARRAGINAETINSANTTEWDDVAARVASGARRRAARLPRATDQPRLPRRGAAAPGRDHRPAGGRRGALHLRLGARLPPRLPPDPHAAGGPAAGHARARDHGDRQRARDRRRRRAAGGHRREIDRATVLVLRGTLERSEPAPGRAPTAGPGRADGLADREPAAPGGLGHRLLPDGGRGRADRLPPARVGPRRARVHRADRAGRAAGVRGGPAGQPGQGPGRDVGAGDGLRQAGPGLRGARRGAAVADRVLPAGGPRGPRHLPGGRRAAAGPGRRGDLGLVRLAGVPRRGVRPRDARGARRLPGGRCRRRRSSPASTCAAVAWR